MDVMSDQIQDDVRSALADDPRIPYAKEIAVEADGDTVVLRGTVGNFGERHAAVATRAAPPACSTSMTSSRCARSTVTSARTPRSAAPRCSG